MSACRRLVTLLVTSATICLLTPSVAQAVNTTCANADFLFLGERAQYFFTAAVPLYFKAPLVAGRSYILMTWAPTQDVSEGGAGIAQAIYSDSTCATSPAASFTQHEPLLSVFGHGGLQETVIPATSGLYYFGVGTGTSFSVQVLLFETTLFSPWWFTGGTNQAYIEVSNTMNTAATAHITLRRSNGTECGTTSVALAANGNAAILINSVGSCAAALAGSAQIAFDGTPGGLAANITTISVPDGTSFDSPFAPRMAWSNFIR